MTFLEDERKISEACENHVSGEFGPATARIQPSGTLLLVEPASV
jgi:hypothetical protein